MPPTRFLNCTVSALFVPNFAPLPFLSQLQQKVAFIRWTRPTKCDETLSFSETLPAQSEYNFKSDNSIHAANFDRKIF